MVNKSHTKALTVVCRWRWVSHSWLRRAVWGSLRQRAYTTGNIKGVQGSHANCYHRGSPSELTWLAVVLRLCSQVCEVDVGFSAVNERVGVGTRSLGAIFVRHRYLCVKKG